LKVWISLFYIGGSGEHGVSITSCGHW